MGHVATNNQCLLQLGFNEIVFPAAIMRAATIFDPFADDAVNYGSMGAGLVMSLTHGFDDQAASMMPDGNLKTG